MFFFPEAAFSFFEKITFSAPLTPIGSETLYFRLFGLLGVGYVGFWYCIAALSEHTMFFKASVWTRLLVLPAFQVGLVLTGSTTTAWLEAAVPVDFLLGLHMLHCLRADRALKAE